MNRSANLRRAALPNFFVIGAPKCGTTTLYHLLKQHPQIYMPSVKEPGFFSSDRQYARGLDYYVESFFRNADRWPVRGEATPWYLYPPQVPERIAAAVGEDARFIAILRDPVERTYSMYLDQVRRGTEHLPFEEALQMEPRRSDEAGPLVNPYVSAYAECSHFATHLHRYIDRFGPDRLLVLLQDDLAAAPENVVRTIHRFLRIEERGGLDTTLHSNPSGVPRSALVERTLRALDNASPQVRNRLARAVPARVYRPALEAVVRRNLKPVPPPPMKPETEQRLRAEFADDVRALESLLGRNLSHWRS